MKLALQFACVALSGTVASTIKVSLGIGGGNMRPVYLVSCSLLRQGHRRRPQVDTRRKFAANG